MSPDRQQYQKVEEKVLEKEKGKGQIGQKTKECSVLETK